MLEEAYVERGGSYIVATRSLITAIARCTQLDWFTFLFARTQQRAFSIADAPAMRDQIPLAHVCVHGVDNQYYYIYTADEGLVWRLGGKYPQAEVSRAAIADLDIPY